MSEVISETGPWTAGQDTDGGIYLESRDFTHDVRLMVTGDFRDSAQKLAYAQMMAERLSLMPPHVHQSGPVWEAAVRLFDGPASAVEWLQSRNPAMGGKRPVDIMSTPEGQGTVLHILGCIEHGVYA